MGDKKGKLTTVSCVTIMMGAMIGSAIFSLSGVTYAMAGPAHILTWIAAAVILLIYGLIAAELACMYPVSGGLYVYPREILGKTRAAKEFWGWTSAWAFLNTGIFGAAFSAIYVSTYLGRILPKVNEHMVLAAVIACAACGLLNIFNISFVGKVNLILVVSISVILLIYSGFGFTAIDSANFAPFFTQGYAGGAGFVSAIPNAMLAYGGIVTLVSVSGDIHEPKKTIPKAMILSIALTTVLYLLVIGATVGMIGTEEFTANPSLQYYPLYAAIDKAFPDVGWLGVLISLSALLALLTTLLVLIMSVANTIAAAAQTGFLPAFLGKYNAKTKTPVASIILSTGLVTAIACFPQFVTEITSTGAVAMVVTVALLSYTLLAARKQMKSSREDFHLPGGRMLPVTVVVVLLLFLLLQPLKAIILCAGWFLVGYVIYGIAIWKGSAAE
ncbi:MAG: APC family permease [Bariatricus massiliensis]|nr:APC family permease [Bariatricus massiliensis]